MSRVSRSTRRRSAPGATPRLSTSTRWPRTRSSACIRSSTTRRASPSRAASRSEPAVALRVVLAEDSLIVREGLRELLAGSPAVDVVGSYGDPDSVLARLGDDRPDVVVTDIRMPPSHTDEGIRLAEHVRERRRRPALCSSASTPTRATCSPTSNTARTLAPTCSRSGSTTAAQLVPAIDTSPGRLGDRPEGRRGAGRGRARAERSPLHRLTPRERACSRSSRGQDNAAIAESLVLTKRAVEEHINSIFTKLGLAGAEDV